MGLPKKTQRKSKKRAVLTTKQAIDRLKRIQPILETNLRRALHIEAVLEVGNDMVGELAVKAFPGAAAYNTIKRSLSDDLAMHVARLFDKGTRNVHANKRDVASIPLMIRLIRQKRCRDALVKIASETHPHLGMGAIFARDCSEAIDRASKAYTGVYRGQFGASGVKAIKLVRDNHMAHSLMKDVEHDVIYHQIFRLIKDATTIIEAASIAIVGGAPQMEERKTRFRAQAKEFWRQVFAKKSATDDCDNSV